MAYGFGVYARLSYNTQNRSYWVYLCLDQTTYDSGMATWASYQIRKIAGCACAGNAGNVFPTRRLQRKPLASDPGMHQGTCVLTFGGGENVPGIPGACAPAIYVSCKRPMHVATPCWLVSRRVPWYLRWQASGSASSQQFIFKCTKNLVIEPVWITLIRKAYAMCLIRIRSINALR